MQPTFFSIRVVLQLCAHLVNFPFCCLCSQVLLNPECWDQYRKHDPGNRKGLVVCRTHPEVDNLRTAGYKMCPATS